MLAFIEILLCLGLPASGGPIRMISDLVVIFNFFYKPMVMIMITICLIAVESL